MVSSAPACGHSSAKKNNCARWGSSTTVISSALRPVRAAPRIRHAIEDAARGSCTAHMPLAAAYPSSCGHSSGHCCCSQVAGRKGVFRGSPSSSANRALMSTGWARISRQSPMGVASKIRCLSSSTDAHTSGWRFPAWGSFCRQRRGRRHAIFPVPASAGGCRWNPVHQRCAWLLCDGFAKLQAYLSNKWFI